jgi:hypothetical protein
MATQKTRDKQLAEQYLAKLDITSKSNEVNPFETKAEQQANTRKNKLFKAISLEGIEYISKNQCEFARDYNLIQGNINACLKKRFKTHKGWKFEYIEVFDE